LNNYFLVNFRISLAIIKTEGFIAFFFAFIIYLKRILGYKKFESKNVFLNQQRANYPSKKHVLNQIMMLTNKDSFLFIIIINEKNKFSLKNSINSITNQLYANFHIHIFGQIETIQDSSKYLKGINGKLISLFHDFQELVRSILQYSNIVFLNSGDQLEPSFLYYNLKEIELNNQIELIYCDEAILNELDQIEHYILKPDFSPNYLLSNNYIHKGAVISTKLIHSVVSKYKPQSTKDLELICLFECIKQPKKVHHIKKILYINHPVNINGYNQILEQYFHVHNKTIKQVLNNIKIHSGNNPFDFKISKALPISQPLISIIIPFKDKVDILETCINSIFTKTSYKNFEVILLSNNSIEKETFQYFELIKKQYKNIRVFEENYDFNYSKINNNGVKYSRGEYIVFLNNDTEIISEDWLENMIGQIEFEHVGIVGAKLLYPNGKIQHAGVVTGFGGCADHIFLEEHDNISGYMNRANTINNYSAVTAACMMISKKTFNEVGGFDEKELKIAFNDVDLCLKVKKTGLYIVYNPFVQLYHYESLSRGKVFDKEEMKRHLHEVNIIKSRWRTDKLTDPFYHPAFSLSKKKFSFD
jgi:GT2 family glycosyltransferase